MIRKAIFGRLPLFLFASHHGIPTQYTPFISTIAVSLVARYYGIAT